MFCQFFLTYDLCYYLWLGIGLNKRGFGGFYVFVEESDYKLQRYY